MRRRTLILVVLFISAGLVWLLSLPQPTGPAEGTTIEGQVIRATTTPRESFCIGTFNIHGCTGADGRRDVARVAECLQNLDFAALNEVHGPRPWERDDQAASLGRRLGLQWLFAPATRNWHSIEFGNGFITAIPVESWKRIPLRANNARGDRNAVLVRLRFRQETVQVLLTHIARSDDAVRRAELREVIDLYLSLPLPAVLLGDLNSDADEPELQRLRTAPDVIDAVGAVRRGSPDPADLSDRGSPIDSQVARSGDRPQPRVAQSGDRPQPQLGAAAPPRIDWIFVRGLRVLDAGLRDNGASDHPMVWAEVAPSLPARQRDTM